MALLIRDARPEDLTQIAQLAGELVRQHHGFDAARFMLIPHVETGYAHFFQSELGNPETVILAAERDGQVVGYAYGRLEERDWNALLDACGALHDIYVHENARRQGVARLLLTGMLDRLRAKGAPRVVLHTASKNHGARAFFAAVGFRETMAELTLEL